jgi:hypothetical protein
LRQKAFRPRIARAPNPRQLIVLIGTSDNNFDSITADSYNEVVVR